MNQPFTSKNDLSVFDKSSTVFYVESTFQPELNKFIKDNYTKIIKLYGAKGINFCYLPYLLQTDAYWETISYNRPYLAASANQLEVQRLYDGLIKKQHIEIKKGGVLLNANFGFWKRTIAAPLDQTKIDIQLFDSLLIRTINYIDSVRRDIPQFQIISHKEELSDNSYDDVLMENKIIEPSFKIINSFLLRKQC